MVLFLIALILFLLLFPVILTYTFLKNCMLYKFKKPFKTMAIAIDIIGNIIGEDFFNDTILKLQYRNKTFTPNFGKAGETISSVLGKNVNKGYKSKTILNKIEFKNVETLTFFGSLLVSILDNIEKDHCIKSIKN